MTTCVVVIPIYNANPKPIEMASLRRVLTVLNGHVIHLFTYEDLDTTVYKAVFEECNKSFWWIILINPISHLLKAIISYV